MKSVYVTFSLTIGHVGTIFKVHLTYKLPTTSFRFASNRLNNAILDIITTPCKLLETLYLAGFGGVYSTNDESRKDEGRKLL